MKLILIGLSLNCKPLRKINLLLHIILANKFYQNKSNNQSIIIKK